ncbi:MAG: Sialidase, partial [Prosthecobacter sp.]|nr:Sialidase [Prosthecobacter sp.]
MKLSFLLGLLAATVIAHADDLPFTQVPAEFAGQFSPGKSPLVFKDGHQVKTAEDWQQRRAEILADWH